MDAMNGRDHLGRFAKGNPGGPGRPPRATEREYLEVTVAAVPVDVWREIIGRAVADALDGDPRAREWLAKLLGLDSPQRIELSTLHSVAPEDLTDEELAAIAARGRPRSQD